MIDKKIISLFVSTIFLGVAISTSTPVKAKEVNKSLDKQLKTEVQNSSGKKLTVMLYCDADNNLEENLLEDIQEMKNGYVNNPNLNLIVLIDRNPDYSDDSKVLGENFADTRLYKIESNSAKRIGGGEEFKEITTNSEYEANMGDAQTLKKFINFCKANYTADKYTLIMTNHGGGVREDKSEENEKLSKAICWDETDIKNGQSDCLYTAEISDVLTKDQSVDVLVFDACLMGASEVAYQYRPGNGGFEAKTMVASSPNVWGYGFKYDNVFKRLRAGGGDNGEEDLTLGGKEKYFDPSTVTDKQLGALFVEEQRDFVEESGNITQQLSCHDLTKVQDVKKSMDKLAQVLWKENKKDDIEKLRGRERDTKLIHYFSERKQSDWINYPYFDIYDLCKKINEDESFSGNIKVSAANVMENVDDMIVYSYAGRRYKGFEEGKNGLSIFLPDGNRIYRDINTDVESPHWKYQRWYNSIDTTTLQPNFYYGKLKWCQDGQDPEINKVGNWFELLDSWFDYSNDSKGGYNGYQW